MNEPGNASPDRPTDDAAPFARPAEGVQPVLSYGRPEDVRDFDWVEVFLANDAMHAGMIASRLQDAGLRARVAGELSAGLGHWGLAGRAGGTGVECIAADAVEARTLIDRIEAERKNRIDARTLPCPRCGHRPASRVIPPLRWIGIAVVCAVVGTLLALPADSSVSGTMKMVSAMLLVAGVLALLVHVEPRWFCRACHHRWTAPAPPEPDEFDDEDDDDGDNNNNTETAEVERDLPPPGVSR